MNIVTFDCTPAWALQKAGHQVKNFSLTHPEWAITLNVTELLEREGLKPDLLIQQEHLGRRLFLAGLEVLPCPTLFIALDSHLNMYWHKHYARLFDLVLTPHLSLFELLPPYERHPTALRYSPLGRERPWTPHRERAHALGLCARVGEQRHVRARMIELLAPRGLVVQSGLSLEELLAFYSQTRLIPNESIAWEVNFRLLEGASCGGLVLTPDIGEDQNAVFEPGREIAVYRHGLELLELIDFYTRRPQEAEAMGRAAWERVRREHLPERRAALLLESGAQAARTRLTGGRAQAAFWLARAQTVRYANPALRPETPALLNQADALLQHPDLGEDERARLAGVSLALLYESKAQKNDAHTDKITALLHAVLEQNLYAGSTKIPVECSVECSAAFSAMAMLQDDFPTAVAFWTRYRAFAAVRQGLEPVTRPTPPSPYHLALSWAKELQEHGLLHQMGFNFSPAHSLPACAMEFFFLAQGMAGNSSDKAWARQQADLCGQIPGYAFLHYGILAQLTLADQLDWRRQLEYGLMALKVCRVEEGLAEMAEAARLAALAGQKDLFEHLLAAAPASQYIVKALAKRRLSLRQ